MKNIKYQSGWTLWSLLFTLSVVGFFSYVGMQLVPVYSGNSNIKNAMKNSIMELDIRKATRSQISLGMSRQLVMDSAQNSVDLRKQLKVVRDKNNLTISIKYDRLVPLFGNISLFLDFHPSLECSFSGGCKEVVVKKDG